MSGLTFTLRAEPDQRLDLSALTPERLAGLGEQSIASLLIGTTRQRLTVGDVFALRYGDIGDIRFVGGSVRFERIAEGLSEGLVRVEGDVGQRAGRAMRGGTLVIEGSAGPFAGSGMAGGDISIQGDAADDLGAPLAGETTGLRGGTIRVEGSAGNRTGDRMRRGTILVKGGAGVHTGCRMLAGTIVVGEQAGAFPGTMMRRGTILLAKGAASTGPTFVDNGVADLSILVLMARALAVGRFSGLFDGRPMRRLGGDTAVLGLGEIFVP